MFSRTKMILQDDCWDVASQPVLTLNYTGPNPHLAYQKIRELFRTVLNVNEAERVQEKDFTWNKKANKEDFSVTWDISKDLDRFSYLFMRVSMSGSAEEKEGGKEGRLTVSIEAFMRTEYPQDTLWERSIIYEIIRMFWHKVVYYEKRREYQDICRTLISRFINELKSFFNLMPRLV
ncbi:MAG: hypothetical protein QXM68_03625 [Candidatus Aenigmatarchaeota archaeon]